MDISNRIKTLRKKHKYTQEELANLLHVKRTTVASWEQGQNSPRMDKVQRMSLLFNVPMSQIIGEDGAPDIDVQTVPDTTNVIYPKGDLLKRVAIPIVGEIACGDPIMAEENIDGYTEQIFTNNVPSGPLFALRCKGDSMEPTIPDGALAIIHEQPEVEDGEIAAVLVDDDCEATLKRIKHQGKLVMLVPDNKQYDPIVLDEKHPGHIVGKAIRYSANL